MASPLPVASPLPSLQVRNGSAVNKLLGWLIEKMAEVVPTNTEYHNNSCLDQSVQSNVACANRVHCRYGIYGSQNACMWK